MSKLSNIFFFGDRVKVIRTQCSYCETINNERIPLSYRRCSKCREDRVDERGTVSQIVPNGDFVLYEVKFSDPDATCLYEPHRLRLLGGDSNTNIRRATTFVYFTDFLTDDGLLQEIII